MRRGRRFSISGRIRTGAPDNPGCYFSMTLGDADFFMLDSRMYRDAEGDPARKTMLGKVQLEWLEKGLKESRANFKIIGCSSQMLADYGQGDTWAAYQPEQKDFVKWLFANKISGVIFVSGSQHGGELTERKAGPGEYPLIEVTTSGLGKESDGGVNKDRIGGGGREPVRGAGFRRGAGASFCDAESAR